VISLTDHAVNAGNVAYTGDQQTMQFAGGIPHGARERRG
jgi:hypothetical protein